MIGQKQLAQRMMQQVDLSDTNVVKALVIGLSQIERAQAEALRECAHTHEFAEHINLQIPDPDARQEFLLDAIEAMQDGEIMEWWLSNATPVHNVSDASAYVGLNEDEWINQQQQWAGKYAEEAPEWTDGRERRDIVSEHCIVQFGVGIDDFEDQVIDLTRETVIRKLLAGNLESIERQLRQAANAERDTDTETDSEEA